MRYYGLDLSEVVFEESSQMGPRRLLTLIDYLPTESVTTGALAGTAPGWSSRDELLVALLNQLILQRRMWADEASGKQLVPVRMPWHETQQQPSTPSEVRAFFGGRARVVQGG